MGKAPLVKVSMNLRADAVGAAKEVATKQRTTMADIVQRGIALERVIEDFRDRGAKVLVELPNGKMERLRFPW